MDINDHISPDDDGESEGIYSPKWDALVDGIEQGVIRTLRDDDNQLFINLNDLVTVVTIQMSLNAAANNDTARVAAQIISEAFEWLPFLAHWAQEKDELDKAESFPQEWVKQSD